MSDAQIFATEVVLGDKTYTINSFGGEWYDPDERRYKRTIVLVREKSENDG